MKTIALEDIYADPHKLDSCLGPNAFTSSVSVSAEFAELRRERVL